MKSPELDTSATFGAPATGLGVAGVSLASGSSTTSHGSPSLTKTPRWGSIRQRFSSIQSRDSPSVPVDSVDDGMWDKNDAAFLEEVARSSPLLLASPERFDSLAPVFEDTYTGRSSMSALRAHSFNRPQDAEHHAALSHRSSYQPRPSSASASTPSSSTSAASAWSTPVVTHDDIPGPSVPYGSTKPWPRSMRRMASATMLPDLPEQNRADDIVTISRPSTTSSAGSMAPPLLPPIGSSASFMSNSFASIHAYPSPGGKSSTHSSVRSSPSIPHSVHAGSDAARSATADQYPRSPSLHSASSFTTSGYTFRSIDDRNMDLDGRMRTISSVSATSSALAPSITGMDRRTSRSVVGSPLAVRTSFSGSRPSSPDALLHDHSAIFAASPILTRVAAESGTMAVASSSARRPSIASVLDSPQIGASSAHAHAQHSTPQHASEPFPQRAGADDAASQTTATARGKRMASASMRGVPGSPTKRSSALLAATSVFAASSISPAEPGSERPVTVVRKHTKNKSSLVSGLRKLMGKKERDNKGASTSDAAPATDSTSARPMPPTPASALSDATVNRRSMRSRAMSIDAPSRGGLNLFGLAPDAFGAETSVELSRDHNDSQVGINDSNAYASPSMARRSPSLDLLRGFGTMGKVSQAHPSESSTEGYTAPASPRSRTKSIDGLTRPLRDVLSQRPRKDSNNAAARASVIEHISHNEARRMTGNTGPVILRSKEAMEEHRSQYATFPTEIGLPDRSNFDVQHLASPPPREANLSQTAAGQNMANPVGALSVSNVQSPARPQRPEDTSPQSGASIEQITPSNSGGAVSGTGSSNIGGIASSGSSFVSSSSAATDPSVVLRAPFSFQSQAYRPYSRDSHSSSSKTQPSPPSSPGSFAVHLPDLAPFGVYDGNNHKLGHRVAPALSSQSALGPVHSGKALDTSSSETCATMPPSAGVQTAKRGHASRRSLNSLVSSKPWSSFLGSPILGSNSSHSHNKRVSAASISRPLSVSSSAFSSDVHSSLSSDVADLTLRASDFAASRSRVRVDSTHSNFSEPGFQGWQQHPNNFGSNVHGHSHSNSHSHNFGLAPSPSGPHLLALAPPAATVASSGSSHHSHCSHSNSSTSTASASASTTALAPTLHRLVPTSSNSALRQQGPNLLRRPATGDETSSPQLVSSGSFQVGGTSAPTVSSPLIRSSSIQAFQDVRSSTASLGGVSSTSPQTTPGFSSRPRPAGAGHRSSASGSSLSHRKRPSFGLAIEPAAHSAFDSIPSPLLRTRRISLALPEGAAPQRPFSTSSASAAGRTPSGSSSSTSPDRSARASAATLSSSHHFDDEDNIEIETLRDSTPVKATYTPSGPLLAAAPLFQGSVPALENAMAAASLGPISNHRHSVSVPMDEGDSPRQHQEESWNRVTGGAALTHGSAEETQQQASRQYMIHSPNEEEGPVLAMPESIPASSGRLSQASKDIAFGSIAGMISKVFEHPFDLVKVRLQTQSADRPPRYAGAFDCFKQTYLHEGIRGLYRGLSMPVLGATLENACLFFTYNQVQSAIRWANGEASSASAAQADAESPLSIPQLAIAAAGAGSVTSLVLTPIELIKCKMQVQMITQEHHVPAKSTAATAASATPVAPVARSQLQQTRSLYTSAIRSASASATSSTQAFKSLDGPLTILRRTIASDGIRGLWLGQTGTLLRETGGGVAWFLAFESCSRYLIARKKALWKRDNVTKKDLTSLELVGSGALAGISYNVVLFPADCVKSTMQTEREMRAVSSSTEKWKGTGFYDTFKKIYRTRGVRGLYAGCGVTCLRSAPSSAIIFLMYNKLEKLSDDYGL
ncbi:related to mitochondrial amino acid transporter ARG-13 [Ustilago trichophora]|uniref:Related to mitochondrial amino acid transporter ARG-13 n=1 Tax=Ustilago trichophora TaxID=86804 RepID=A0A5C3EE69_9BASI|nr:related to mitochondrial amino acid transporter ARG-13 [Ustilago trichophora]